MLLGRMDGVGLENWWPVIVAIFVGIITIIKTYIGGQECPSDNKINEKVVLITGASSGLGFETAKQLAQRGATIILTCRNTEKGNEARKRIRKEIPNATIDVKHLDVSNITHIKEFISNLKQYKSIDILINNAGIMFYPYEITNEGFEMHFVTNYLGHFVLTHLLLSKLKESKNGQIINVCSQAYSSGYINLEDLNFRNGGEQRLINAFAQSKLALVLMTRYMAKLLKDTNVRINSVDPGLMRNTNHMNRSRLKTSIPIRISVWPWMWLFLKTAKQGCQTIVYLAVEPKLANTTGLYFNDCEPKDLSENCNDYEMDEKLYELSCSLTNVNPIRIIN